MGTFTGHLPRSHKTSSFGSAISGEIFVSSRGLSQGFVAEASLMVGHYAIIATITYILSRRM
jgi:hypothetical protein